MGLKKLIRRKYKSNLSTHVARPKDCLILSIWKTKIKRYLRSLKMKFMSKMTKKFTF